MIQFLLLLSVHWFADFVLQTHWQAQNKSKSLDALGRHVGIYTIVLLFAVPWIFPGQLETYSARWFAFVVSNGAFHFVTDYFTSRASRHFSAKQDWHNFFVVVGLDQLIHQATLAGTMMLIFGVR
jgi:uncharacterized protein DUF3307